MIYLEMFITFLKIGLFTFGGGMAMIPLIQQEVVKHGWMTMEQMVNFIAISESTPGPLAINMSTYVGFNTNGIIGALVCTLGIVTPSFVIILIVSGFYMKFKKSKYVEGAMKGIRPAVVGMIGAAVISVGLNVFDIGTKISDYMTVKNGVSIVIFIIALVLMIKRLNPMLVMMISGILGIIIYIPLG